MRMLTIFVGLFAIAASASAQDVTWRKDVQPIIAAKCAGCHGPNQPGFADWNVQRVKDKNLAPQLVTYAYLMNHVVWPETGAVMRRLDDGKGAAGANLAETHGAGDGREGLHRRR